MSSIARRTGSGDRPARWCWPGCVAATPSGQDADEPGRRQAGRLRRRRSAGHRQHEPARRRRGRRLRGLEPPVRDAHRQGGRRLRDDPRPRRVVEGLRRRARPTRTSCATGLKWSDGEPLTAEDIAYTINTRARGGVAQPLAAVAEPRPPRRRRPARSRSRPRCPTRSCRRWTSTSCPSTSGARSTPDASRKYEGIDGVGSGPFTLEKLEKGQFGRLKANPNYWGGKPAIDKVVFRMFTNPDAMVAALKTGEIDAAHDIPATRSTQLEEDPSIVDGRGLAGRIQRDRDQRRRRASKKRPPGAAGPAASARRSPTRSTRRRSSTGSLRPRQSRRETLSPSPEPEVDAGHPRRRAARRSTSTRRSAILDEAGYKDTDGDGIREMPGRRRSRSTSATSCAPSRETAPAIAEFVTGWLKEIGIGDDAARSSTTAS